MMLCTRARATDPATMARSLDSELGSPGVLSLRFSYKRRSLLAPNPSHHSSQLSALLYSLQLLYPTHSLTENFCRLHSCPSSIEQAERRQGTTQIQGTTTTGSAWFTFALVEQYGEAEPHSRCCQAHSHFGSARIERGNVLLNHLDECVLELS